MATILSELPAVAGQVGPSRVVSALEQQLAETYHFAVTLRDGQVVGADLSQLPDAVNVSIINGILMKLAVADAFQLVSRPEVEWAWYLHPDEANLTIRTLQALDLAATTMDKPGLVNLSIGPVSSLYRLEPEPNAPVQRALVSAANSGLIPLVAIGNSGDQPGYVNPWSTPEQVIAVGAWDHHTQAVWSFSSTGSPELPETWPDVVAPGVDVIGPFPSNLVKTEGRKARDEGDPRFRATVPEAEWDQYTLESGTSQATAVTSAAAAQVLRFLLGVIEERSTQPGELMFSLEGGRDRLSDYDRLVPRLTGKAEPNPTGGMTYTYWLDEPWKMVKQILIDTALPVSGSQPWQSGAGLVSLDYIREQFGAYGIDPPQIFPTKVL